MLCFEIGLILTLYAAWQYIGGMSKVGVEQAYDAGRLIANIEAAIGWPTEAQLQSLVLPHEQVIAFADWYYSSLHIPVFVITLGWVLVRHRADWPFTRTTTVLLTGACLLIQFKAVAPPRLLPELNIVDTATINGRSVYAALPGANQLAAMPSVHIAWAAAVALFIIVSARTKFRWLAIAYPLLTLFVVVVTGNHFVLDGVAALVLLGIAVAITLAFPSQRPSRFASAPHQQDAHRTLPDESLSTQLGPGHSSPESAAESTP